LSAIFGLGVIGGLTPASDCVAGKAGGRAWYGTGATPSPSPPLLSTKTFAAGFATITRAGAGTSRPDGVRNSAAASGVTLAGGTGRGGAAGAAAAAAAGGAGIGAVARVIWGMEVVARVGGGSGAVARVGGGISGPEARGERGAGGADGAGGGVAPTVGTLPDGGFGGKRGVVLAVGGAPVSGGAEGLAAGVSAGGGGVAREMVGIGLVIAVDQAGGAFVTGAGSSWLEVFIGNVVAAETFGFGVGVIFPVAGRSGRGGRLMRRVSRFGVLGSLPSGVGSAIIFCFYSVF
jgi:hypothetical protein